MLEHAEPPGMAEHAEPPGMAGGHPETAGDYPEMGAERGQGDINYSRPAAVELAGTSSRG